MICVTQKHWHQTILASLIVRFCSVPHQSFDSAATHAMQKSNSIDLNKFARISFPSTPHRAYDTDEIDGKLTMGQTWRGLEAGDDEELRSAAY
jgi:hypothetical protein